MNGSRRQFPKARGDPVPREARRIRELFRGAGVDTRCGAGPPTAAVCA